MFEIVALAFVRKEVTHEYGTTDNFSCPLYHISLVYAAVIVVLTARKPTCLEKHNLRRLCSSAAGTFDLIAGTVYLDHCL